MLRYCAVAQCLYLLRCNSTWERTRQGAVFQFFIQTPPFCPPDGAEKPVRTACPGYSVSPSADLIFARRVLRRALRLARRFCIPATSFLTAFLIGPAFFVFFFVVLRAEPVAAFFFLAISTSS